MGTTPRIQRRIIKYSCLFKMLGIISNQEFKAITGYDHTYGQR